MLGLRSLYDANSLDNSAHRLLEKYPNRYQLVLEIAREAHFYHEQEENLLDKTKEYIKPIPHVVLNKPDSSNLPLD
jgi:hypothetical protein